MRRTNRRGAALMEATVALGILAIGMTGVIALTTQIQRTGSNSAFHTTSLSMLGTFAAELQAASCDVLPPLLAFDPAITDGGINQVGVTITTPAVRSIIRTVGDFPGREGAPPMRLSYVVTGVTAPGPNAPPNLNVDVIIREIRRDAASDGATQGYWIKRFTLLKVCSVRAETRDECGAPPCARGEYY